MDFIGKVIKASRISKKISIQEASSELKISTQILKKIENDELDEYIDIVYYLGHIRSYSEFLALDSNQIIEQFKLQHSFNKEKISEVIPKPLVISPVFKFGRYLSFASIILIFVLANFSFDST